jgi:hypothetical protein
MALLVVSAADFPAKDFPECKTRKLGELINPAANEAWVGPKNVTLDLLRVRG